VHTRAPQFWFRKAAVLRCIEEIAFSMGDKEKAGHMNERRNKLLMVLRGRNDHPDGGELVGCRRPVAQAHARNQAVGDLIKARYLASED
jgi:hypothetical protein